MRRVRASFLGVSPRFVRGSVSLLVVALRAVGGLLALARMVCAVLSRSLAGALQRAAVLQDRGALVLVRGALGFVRRARPLALVTLCQEMFGSFMVPRALLLELLDVSSRLFGALLELRDVRFGLLGALLELRDVRF